jgi:hypothetical protein
VDAAPVTSCTVVVAVDVGKTSVALSVTDAFRRRLLGPVEFASPFRTLTSVPGWGVVRVAASGAALGDPHRWPGSAQVYRAAGLSPMQNESAGKRRDGTHPATPHAPRPNTLTDTLAPAEPMTHALRAT